MGTYLDYAATTPMSPGVVEVMAQSLGEDYGNASSQYTLGRESRHKIEEARQFIAQTLNAPAEDIIFTSGGTESNNSAIIQTARARANQGKHLITTAAEHSSVYQTMVYLESQGFEVTYLDLDETGHIRMEDLRQAIRPDTILVSIIAGNNEVGSVQDLTAIGQLLDQEEIFFHTDTVQTYLNVPLDVQALHIDALSVSAHKFYGPKGVGFLYYRNAKSDFHSYLHGGNQENQHRAGTEPVPLILGMAKAISDVYENRQAHRDHLVAMRNYFLEGARDRGLVLQVNGPQDPELAHVLNFYWPGQPSDQALIRFDLQDVYLSAGSACTAGSLEPSRVLVSMYGADSPRVSQSLRISFGDPTTQEDLDKALDVMKDIEKK